MLKRRQTSSAGKRVGVRVFPRGNAFFRTVSGLMMAGLLVVGCNTVELAERLEMTQPRIPAEEVAEHRSNWVQERDAKSLNWLLEKKIRSGMSRSEVEQILGEDGEPILNSAALIKDSSGYQSTDKGYRWGPDGSGRSIYLFFRDGRLVNFQPQEFAMATTIE